MLDGLFFVFTMEIHHNISKKKNIKSTKKEPWNNFISFQVTLSKSITHRSAQVLLCEQKTSDVLILYFPSESKHWKCKILGLWYTLKHLSTAMSLIFLSVVTQKENGFVPRLFSLFKLFLLLLGYEQCCPVLKNMADFHGNHY